MNPYLKYWFNQFIRFIDYLINILCKLTEIRDNIELLLMLFSNTGDLQE